MKQNESRFFVYLRVGSRCSLGGREAQIPIPREKGGYRPMSFCGNKFVMRRLLSTSQFGRGLKC